MSNQAYKNYLEDQVHDSQLKNRLAAGDKVCFTSNYDIFHGTVLKLTEKAVKIHRTSGIYKEEDFTIPWTQVAKYGDKIVLVWELWHESNSKQSYRLERDLYPLARQAIEDIPQQTYLWEKEFKNSTPKEIQNYIELVHTKISNKAPSFKF